MTTVYVFSGHEISKNIDGVPGWKYEITVYPIPKNHMRIAEVISKAIKAIDEE